MNKTRIFFKYLLAFIVELVLFTYSFITMQILDANQNLEIAQFWSFIAGTSLLTLFLTTSITLILIKKKFYPSESNVKSYSEVGKEGKIAYIIIYFLGILSLVVFFSQFIIPFYIFTFIPPEDITSYIISNPLINIILGGTYVISIFILTIAAVLSAIFIREQNEEKLRE